VARPHIRGGGEYGHGWWAAGRLRNKPNTFSDLFAVVDDLVSAGIADPARLAFEGGSNGGMLAGVVATQRPQQFRAVAGVVPVLDLMRLRRDPLTLAISGGEYGDSADPAIADVLSSYSPYHQVRPERTYPATLWLCGANDPRCPAWHSRKMVAALQATCGGGPHLLAIAEDVGHGSAMRGPMALLQARWVTFILKELELL
jgi:prolyl oligopeptidase